MQPCRAILSRNNSIPSREADRQTDGHEYSVFMVNESQLKPVGPICTEGATWISGGGGFGGYF